jgi:hypothetical protein
LEDYKDQGLQRDIEFVTLESRLVQEFQNNHQVRFEIKLEDLSSNRFESKVVWISVGLIGATSAEPFSCTLEHFGSSKAKLRDGSIIDTTEKPRAALIQSSTTLDQLNGDLPDISSVDHFKQGFWGRNSATTWFLSIEEEQFIEKQIDLSSLSEKIIAKCFS